MAPETPFYEFMREVAPGDLVFSFVDTRILAVGVVRSYCYESPKPVEFGAIGMNWEQIGWRVRVDFTLLQSRIRPKEHIGLLFRRFQRGIHHCRIRGTASSRSI